MSVTNASAALFNYRGVVADSKDRKPKAWAFNALSQIPFDLVASVPAGETNATVLARIRLAQYAKVPKVIFSFDTIDAIDGSDSLNIALGAGAYATAGVQASGSYTLSGTPTTTDTNTYTIGGHAVVTPQTTGNTLAQQATADAAVINANGTVGPLVIATPNGADVEIRAKATGTAGNGITTTAASSAGDTLTANQGALAGGVNAGAITLPQPDFFLTTGVPGIYTPGANPAITYPPNGTALFAPDLAINATTFPGVSTGSGGFGIFAPPGPNTGLVAPNPLLNAWDAVYAPGTEFTLRANTNAGVGSITNLKAALVVALLDVNVNDNDGVPLVDW